MSVLCTSIKHAVLRAHNAVEHLWGSWRLVPRRPCFCYKCKYSYIYSCTVKQSDILQAKNACCVQSYQIQGSSGRSPLQHRPLPAARHSRLKTTCWLLNSWTPNVAITAKHCGQPACAVFLTNQQSDWLLPPSGSMLRDPPLLPKVCRQPVNKFPILLNLWRHTAFTPCLFYPCNVILTVFTLRLPERVLRVLPISFSFLSATIWPWTSRGGAAKSTKNVLRDGGGGEITIFRTA